MEADIEQAQVKIEVTQAQENSEVKIIKLEGVLDSVTTDRAEKIIGPVIEQGRHIIVDCTLLSYVNSLGLAFLMKCHIQTKRRNGSFKLINPTKSISSILEQCGVWNFLKIYGSLQDALKSLEG